MISDARLPSAALVLKKMRSVEGGIMVHREEENSRGAFKKLFSPYGY
jgi:hypothetical protein